MKLVIVESPTKAKTISKFLGRKFTVKSSYGHVRDLPTKKMGIDIEHDFEPEYIIPTKAIERVEELKKLSDKSEGVILATDEDREGEAISWHLVSALGLDLDNAQRIVFHEITKTAIEKALENPRKLDLNLVDAQQARRILDRLVGYELSPFLWKKIRRGLSAGRVQSVALRLIVEREREIEKFVKEEFWTVGVKLRKSQEEFLANLSEKNGEKIESAVTLKLFAGDYKTKKSSIKNKKEAENVKTDLESANFTVAKIDSKETQKNPPAPFTTSTLQQAAINKLGFSSKQTMILAQKLYEQGFITYMRTDSTNLSMESMLKAKTVITKEFGQKFALENPRFYKAKAKGAQEAHEAIRPAYPEKTPAELELKLESGQFRLYRLIWQRMMASQMQPAIFNSVRADISAEGKKEKYLLKANGSTVKFEGYLKAYGDKTAEGDTLLPKFAEGDKLDLSEILTEQKFTSAPPRYNEASLVRVMEENGIGRPSTYAPTISTIIERKYVDKNEEKKLFPLEIGMVVNDMLVENFPEIVDMGFTAKIELDFDEIAEGKKEWVPIIREFYTPFHKHLKAKDKSVEKKLEKLDRKCPECGGDLVMKFGRFGKFIACSNYPSCKFTEKTDEEKKVDEEHTGEICDICGAPMVVKRGKFGTFMGCSNYPECKGIKKIEKKTGIKCPKCNDGDIIERKSKKGRLFFGCSAYPKCDFALWNKPTSEKCPNCGALMVFAAKGETRCSNKECSSNAKNVKA